jgi:hypothetical protein
LATFKARGEPPISARLPKRAESSSLIPATPKIAEPLDGPSSAETNSEGWVRTFTAHDTIELLKTGEVTHLSLDHDLGLAEDGTEFPNGYQVLKWLEEAVATRRFVPPDIQIHSANAVGIANMQAAANSIKTWDQINKDEDPFILRREDKKDSSFTAFIENQRIRNSK